MDIEAALAFFRNRNLFWVHLLLEIFRAKIEIYRKFLSIFKKGSVYPIARLRIIKGIKFINIINIA